MGVGREWEQESHSRTPLLLMANVLPCVQAQIGLYSCYVHELQPS